MTGITEGSTKALFICFSSFALWLYFKLTLILHIHSPLHTYFALASFFGVNLGCLRGLNMAVITGCYVSHVSDALLPSVNNCGHWNFNDKHKKAKRREVPWMSMYVYNIVCLYSESKCKCQGFSQSCMVSLQCSSVFVCFLGCTALRSCQTPTLFFLLLMPRQHVCRVTPGHYDKPNNPVSFHSSHKNSNKRLPFPFCSPILHPSSILQWGL